MKLGTMFKDVTTSLFKRPVTERYPFVRKEDPDRLRGKLKWNLETCTGCGLCAMDCPANAITVHVIDKKEKRFVFEYYVNRCTFCAQCVHSCRQGCIELAKGEWELAALNQGAFRFIFGEQANIDELLAGKPSANADSSTNP